MIAEGQLMYYSYEQRRKARNWLRERNINWKVKTQSNNSYSGANNGWWRDSKQNNNNFHQPKRTVINNIGNNYNNQDEKYFQERNGENSRGEGYQRGGTNQREGQNREYERTKMEKLQKELNDMRKTMGDRGERYDEQRG